MKKKAEHQNIPANHINQPFTLVILLLCCVGVDARVWGDSN